MVCIASQKPDSVWFKSLFLLSQEISKKGLRLFRTCYCLVLLSPMALILHFYTAITTVLLSKRKELPWHNDPGPTQTRF